MPRIFSLVALGLAIFAYAQPQDLLFYAPFDGTSTAAFARGDARPQGGFLHFVPGLRGDAVLLNSDCIFRLTGNFRVAEGTIAAWIRPHWAGTDAGAHYLFCIYGQRELPQSWARNRFHLDFASGRCRFIIFAHEPGQTFGVSGSIRDWQPEQWHHVAATWKNINSSRADAELCLYLDGQLAETLRDKQIEVGPTDEFMAIGRDQDASADYGDLDCDDFFIYNRALTAQEIAQGLETLQKQPYIQAVPSLAKQRHLPGWADAAWPYRVSAVLEAENTDRRDIFVECPLKLDLASMGKAGQIDLASVRVQAAEAPAPPQATKAVFLPARAEEDVVQWLVPDVVPAGQQRRFWIYFKAQEYVFTQPLVSFLQKPETEAGPSLPAIPDYATQAYGRGWDFDDGSFAGIDQWGNKPEYIRNRRIENGVLHMDVSKDPYFIWGDMWGQVATTNQKVAIDLEKYPLLEMKIRQSVPYAKWELFGRVGQSPELLYYSFYVSGTGWQRIRIDLRKQARWSGVLSAFRIDPTQGLDEAHIEIDWIRLLAITSVAHEAVETIGQPSGEANSIALQIPHTTVPAGQTQEIVVLVKDVQGRPVAGQPVEISLASPKEGKLQEASTQRSWAVAEHSRRGLTDKEGKLRVCLTAAPKAATTAQISAKASFTNAPVITQTIKTIAGPPHHYRLEPVDDNVAIFKGDGPHKILARLVDAYNNPVQLDKQRKLEWRTEAPGKFVRAAAQLDAQGQAAADWQGEESRRWTYQISVKDQEGLRGEAIICVLPAKPRTEPIVLGPNGYFRKGPHGPVWLPLGGFYANWIGLPERGEEGRRVISFVDATEEQIIHWLDFLASQGVTAMRFMLRAHRPKGSEPMDIIGRVNMPLFVKVLRYMDLARRYDIKFLLVIHEDYTKPSYYNEAYLETFCLPHYEREDLDKLPPYQRRFIRDRKLITSIAEKYTDPDVIACQDQYTRQLVPLFKDNPQLFGWELENEMVACPLSWARHAVSVIRSVDPVTPICVSHGGGGLHTADPIWWTRQAGIDFYTYHLYPHRRTTSMEMDYGAAVDVLTAYGRMAGVCMLGEAAGDEFNYYPPERDEDRRYIMRDIIWLSLVNGNPGCFFWNARGFEVEQFRLVASALAPLDLTRWQRLPAPVGIDVRHPLDNDRYYRTPGGIADYWMMGRYAQYYRSRGEEFDFTWEPQKYAATADLKTFAPPPSGGPLAVSPGWQAASMQDVSGQGLAYVRNFAGIRQWTVPERADMFLRERKPAPLTMTFRLPAEKKIRVLLTNLDTGEQKQSELAGNGVLELGVTEHDWAIAWRTL